MTASSQFMHTLSKESAMPTFNIDGPPRVTISQDFALELAQASARGIVLYGQFINDHGLSLTIDGWELEGFTINPNAVEDKRYQGFHPGTAEVARVRAAVQRLFEGAKKENAAEYSHYVEAVDRGTRLGQTPVPILWDQELLEVYPLGLSNLCAVVIPRGRMMIAVDGETQIAARFQAWHRDRSLKEIPFPVLVAHGRTEEWARQTFHDVNVFGIKPNAALAISMDGYDAATQVARGLIDNVNFLNGRVNMTARQLGKAERQAGEIMTISSLRGSVVTLAKGISGVSIGAKSMRISDEDKAELPRLATQWWSSLSQHLGTVLTDPDSVASGPAALSALGAVGHLAFQHEGNPDDVVARLAYEVDWIKGPRWAGIAGKFTPKGVFSLGGTKENAYAIFAALTDSTQESYHQIRKRR